MDEKQTLNADDLAVESFEPMQAVPPQVAEMAEMVLTCMQTDCGRFRCCA